jgi:hypothetical protein
VPAETSKDSKGRYCRRYVQKLNSATEQGVYYGMACRDLRGAGRFPAADTRSPIQFAAKTSETLVDNSLILYGF